MKPIKLPEFGDFFLVGLDGPTNGGGVPIARTNGYDGQALQFSTEETALEFIKKNPDFEKDAKARVIKDAKKAAADRESRQAGSAKR